VVECLVWASVLATIVSLLPGLKNHRIPVTIALERR
jgi:hypothetical protein